MNIAAISGHLTRDPELRTTPDGYSVCRFSVGVKRPNTKDKTDFINCIAWRGTADFLQKYFRKGQRIEVVGCIVSQHWEDKDGNKRISFEIQCDSVAFGESKKNTEERAAETQAAIDACMNIDEDDLPF